MTVDFSGLIPLKILNPPSASSPPGTAWGSLISSCTMDTLLLLFIQLYLVILMQPENKQHDSNIYGQPGLGTGPQAGFGLPGQNINRPQPQVGLSQAEIVPTVYPETPGLPISSPAVIYTSPSPAPSTSSHRPLALLRCLPKHMWLLACAVFVIGSVASTLVYVSTHRVTPTHAAQQHPQVATKPDTDTTQSAPETPSTKQTQATTSPKPTPKPTVKAPSGNSASNSSGGVSSTPNYTVSEEAPSVAGAITFYYAAGSQIVTGATGASVDATLALPTVPYDPSISQHSLIEMAVSVGGNYNYIEIGWSAGDNFYNNQHPHMFISRWIGTSNVCEPQPTGCGFVPVSTTNLPDEELASSGTVNYKINYSGGNWNVYFNGDLVGYFPESLWGPGHGAVSQVQVYGEVAEKTGSTVCIPMGNGISGASTGSTEVSNYTLIGSSEPAAFSSFNETASHHYYLGSPAATSFSLGGPGC